MCQLVAAAVEEKIPASGAKMPRALTPARPAACYTRLSLTHK